MHTKVKFNKISDLSCFGKQIHENDFLCVSMLCEKYNDN